MRHFACLCAGLQVSGRYTSEAWHAWGMLVTALLTGGTLSVAAAFNGLLEVGMGAGAVTTLGGMAGYWLTNRELTNLGEVIFGTILVAAVHLVRSIPVNHRFVLRTSQCLTASSVSFIGTVLVDE